MRYHKAIDITQVEARFIIDTSTSSKTNLIVIQHRGRWYDVRSLTRKELDDFIEDLMRRDVADVQAGCNTPH
jgi:hypothetical protein